MFFMFFRECSHFYDIHYWSSNNEAIRSLPASCLANAGGTGIKVTTMMLDNDATGIRFSLSAYSVIASTVQGLRVLRLCAMTVYKECTFLFAKEI